MLVWMITYHLSDVSASRLITKLLLCVIIDLIIKLFLKLHVLHWLGALKKRIIIIILTNSSITQLLIISKCTRDLDIFRVHDILSIAYQTNRLHILLELLLRLLKLTL